MIVLNDTELQRLIDRACKLREKKNKVKEEFDDVRDKIEEELRKRGVKEYDEDGLSAEIVERTKKGFKKKETKNKLLQNGLNPNTVMYDTNYSFVKVKKDG